MQSITTKWPGVVIVGKPLTPEQVIDVAFNTSHRIWSSDKSPFARKVKSLDGFNGENPGLELDYFDNSIGLGPWIGGNENWVHHDGTIFMWNNIGKWPSDKEVQSDLERIAERFPFIDMVVSIMSEEIEFLEFAFGDTKLRSCKNIVLPDPSLFIHQYIVKDGNVSKQEYDPHIVEPLLPVAPHYAFLNSLCDGGTYFQSWQEYEFLKLYKEFFEKGKE